MCIDLEGVVDSLIEDFEECSMNEPEFDVPELKKRMMERLKTMIADAFCISVK